MNNVSQSARIIILNNILYFLAGSFDIGTYMYVCLYVHAYVPCARLLFDFQTLQMPKFHKFLRSNIPTYLLPWECRRCLTVLAHVASESDLSRIKYLSLRSDSFVELSRLLLFYSFPFVVRKIFCTSRSPLGHSRGKQISLGVHTVRFTDTGEFSSN